MTPATAAKNARPVLVYGLGRSGLAAARLLLRQGIAVDVFELRPSGEDVDAVLAEGARRVSEPSESAASVCIAAPGVPIDHPDLVALAARGVEVIGEVEWVTRTVPGRYVGVTGTAGKGSTTRWLTDTLVAAGVKAVAGGNIDPALAAVARPGATHVVEMSSFQLERCPTFRPSVAIVLNLGEDHIDRHGSVRAYHAAKRNLVANLGPSDTFVFNADDSVAASWAARSPARTRSFSLRSDAGADADLGPGPGLGARAYDGSDAYPGANADPRGDAFPGANAGHATEAGSVPNSGPGPNTDLNGGERWLRLDGAPLIAAKELRVAGGHQVANGLAMALAADALGVGRAAIAAGLRAFTGLPGRYAAAGTVGAVRFIEDSIATRPLAVAAALRATPTPFVWIAGGQAKGSALDDLLPLVAERVDLMVGIGQAGPSFAAAFGGVTRTQLCDQADGKAALRCAVAAALEHLDERHGGRGNVLLAPLAASFDQFLDYGERARVFREVIAEFATARNEREETTWTRSS